MFTLRFQSCLWNTACLFILCGLFAQLVNAAAPDRRRDQFGKDFGYFIYPIGGEIPGLGKAAGLGGTVLNMFDTDADFTAFNIDGDFNASGYTLLDMHLMKNKLLFDIGAYDFTVAPQVFRRGMDSSVNDYFLPKAQGAYNVAQLTWTNDERRYEGSYRMLSGESRLLSVHDAQGNAFSSIDTDYHDAKSQSIGMVIDRTDDRLDPRNGNRFEMSMSSPGIDNVYRSAYLVTDINYTHYVPFRKWDTLAFNVFYSRADITRQASTNYSELQNAIGFSCSTLAAPAQADCYASESKYLNDVVAQNTYGNSTALGGTQRLRSFASGRYHAGKTSFFGAEYRWNLTDEYTPFNIYIAKGVRTGMQLAFFYELGSVADEDSDLFKKTRQTYGVGLRAVLSGVIIRADYSGGEEGNQFLLFINYPWSMFSVDSPG